MQQFRNVLFVSHGISDDRFALLQALSLARNFRASLHALIVCPEFPETLARYRDLYLQSLRDQLEQSIVAASAILGMSRSDVNMMITVDCGSTPGVRITRHVIRGGYDLLIKSVGESDQTGGLDALDMELLRKCPSPVWLCRTIDRPRNTIRVAVAIDPECQESAGRELSLRLLQVARTLADSCSGRLLVVSCWHYEYEQYLSRNPWFKLPESELRGVVEAKRSDHEKALKELLAESAIGGDLRVDHIKGRPQEAIPRHVLEEQVDILVMGTVARTGIPGFTIGNTAENIARTLSCSLLTLKPPGFVSPVKVY